MALFRYKASTTDQDTVFGEIHAESYERALSKLLSLGFFDVSLDEYADDSNEGGSVGHAYEFEGIKSDGSMVRGEVTANSRIEAIRMLLHQYRLVPEYLCETDALEQEKRYMRERGLLDLVNQLDSEEQKLFSREEVLRTVLTEAEKDFHREIDALVQESSDFLERNRDRLTASDFEKLQRRVREVLRVKNMRDFKALVGLKTSLRELMNLLQKRMGEIVDQDLRVFFNALKEYENIYHYAELVRKAPDIRRKLFFFELQRALRSWERGDALKKLGVLFRGGFLPEEKRHHPAWYEIQRFLGALTFFYLVLYGVSYYISQMKIVTTFSFLESLSHNEILSSVLTVLFLAWTGFTVMLYFLRPGWLQKILVVTVGVSYFVLVFLV